MKKEFGRRRRLSVKNGSPISGGVAICMGFGVNVKRIQGWLVFKAHRLVYHSTLGWRVIQKRRRFGGQSSGFRV